MQTITLKESPIILKNQDFQTILIKVLFPFNDSINLLAKNRLLPSMLSYISQSYPTEESFQKEKKRRFILGTGCSRTVIGNEGCFSFSMIIPDTYALGHDYLDSQFQFFQEMIYSPFVENGGFSKKELDREIVNLETSIKGVSKDFYSYHSLRVKELVDEGELFSKSLVHHQDLIQTVTPQNLYEYYLEVITKQKPIIYIMGDVDEERIKELCRKYFPHMSSENQEIEADIWNFLPPRKDVQEIEEDSIFKDSSISFLYKIQDMKKEDIIPMAVTKSLLTSLSSRLLNQRLRNEKDLIYSSFAAAYGHFGVFEITACIHKNHVDEVKKVLIEILKDLQNEEIVTPLLNNIKERKRLDLIRQLDDKYSLFSDFIFADLGIDDTLQEHYQKCLKITAHDIAEFVRRFYLDTIYFLKEEDHE